MEPHKHLAQKPSAKAEASALQDATDYIKTGPGTWQPLGLVIRRVIGRIVVEGKS